MAELKYITPIKTDTRVSADNMNNRFAEIEAESEKNRTSNATLCALLESKNIEQDIKIQMFTNDNILFNGDFSVWQRGQPKTNTQSIEYISDRWACWSGSTGNTFSRDNGLVWDCKGNCNLMQLIDNSSKLKNQKYTLSIFIKCINSVKVSIQLKTGVIGGSVISEIPVSGSSEWQRITLSAVIQEVSEGQCVAINIHSNDIQTIRIAYVKFERGEYATTFIARTYNQELFDCQAYYVNLNNAFVRADSITTNTIDFNFSLVTKLRLLPTITGAEGVSWRVRQIQYGAVTSGFSATAYAAGNNNVCLRFSKPNHNLADAMLDVSGGSGIGIDAEIY